ncbi:MAG: hypothetical protein EA400_08555 [Chromatiaceae bacterium]|nr:MAG: hypothetical protein EA400_08555 [Chromatiaceae bacterium]
MLNVGPARPGNRRLLSHLATDRHLHHEAAVTYLDMTPVLIIVAAGFMALRYVSRGFGMQEFLVLAGVGTSLFYLLLYFGPAAVRAARIEVATLRDQAAVLGTVGEVVLIGSAQAEGVRPQPPTLEVTGDRLTFVYADPAQLDALAGRSLAQVDLVLQVRHAPGATLPALDAPDPGTAVVPARLERWLP